MSSLSSESTNQASLSQEQWQKLNERLATRIAGQHGQAYWRSLDELIDDERYRHWLAGEFPQHETLWSAPIDRRRVLKLMAASLALGGLTACDSQPQEYLVPYVNMPEGVIPGMPRYYATSCLRDGYAQGLLAQNRDGRPIKLEGNPDHPATMGACDSISQAAILSLYDPERGAAVTHKGNPAPYSRLLGDILQRHARWDANQGQGLAFLTDTLTSPSAIERLEELRERWPRARWYSHAPVERQALHRASHWLFGEPLEPIYHLDRAAVVFSLDADFLQGQPGFLHYARDFAQRRRPRDNDTLLRLYAVESTPSITGSMAEHRQRLSHPRVLDAARQLGAALGLDVAPPQQPPLPGAWIDALVADLRRQAPAALVIPGDQQAAEVHAIAQAINAELGVIGTTVDYIDPVAAQQAASLDELTDAMQAGDIASLIILDANPAYSAPVDLAFAQALEQVEWRLCFGASYHETARLCHWFVPATHALETWGDARAYDGTLSLLQPLIQPLHGGKTALQFLAAVDEGLDHDPRELLRSHWRRRHSDSDFSGKRFEDFWRASLKAGFVADSAFEPRTPRLDATWTTRLSEPRPPEDTLILQLRPDPSLWDGEQANNAWLQELPRPLTKVTWENPLLIAPRLAVQQRLENGDLVRLGVGEQRLEVPVYVLPGMPDGAVTLPLGGGRWQAGHIGDGVGSNAYALRQSDSPWAMPVTLEKLGERRELATTQDHHALEGRELIRAASLATYRDDPHFAQHEAPDKSLYPEPWPASREAEHAWAMSIDLSACIGCNACVTACQAENNIPVVGAEQVRMGREMHWIRIDRYFKGVLEDPELVFQPVTCMHCENAPCEYVCPVAATQHSADGLNEMVYNRCIGTRYCSQNCPYKVRRFNWFDYTAEHGDYTTPKPAYNPEVTVRSRGVMEKCTYCVQRINRQRLNADMDGRELTDGDIRTACQQSCPTQAIVFGDMKDPQSYVSRLKAHPLDYAMLGHLNVRPRTTYLAAVRDYNPALGASTAPEAVGHFNPATQQVEDVFFRGEPS